jgi:hypothetical protein
MKLLIIESYLIQSCIIIVIGARTMTAHLRLAEMHFQSIAQCGLAQKAMCFWQEVAANCKYISGTVAVTMTILWVVLEPISVSG